MRASHKAALACIVWICSLIAPAAWAQCPTHWSALTALSRYDYVFSGLVTGVAEDTAPETSYFPAGTIGGQDVLWRIYNVWLLDSAKGAPGFTATVRRPFFLDQGRPFVGSYIEVLGLKKDGQIVDTVSQDDCDRLAIFGFGGAISPWKAIGVYAFGIGAIGAVLVGAFVMNSRRRRNR